jgi:subtilisin family serine protease
MSFRYLKTLGTMDALIIPKASSTLKDRTALRAHVRAPQFATSAATTKSLRAEAFMGAKQASVRYSDLQAPFVDYPNLGVCICTIDSTGLRSLRSARNVAKVLSVPELSLIRPVPRMAADAAPASNTNWGLARLRLPDLWNQGIDGKGVMIGHLDTGVDSTHPALAAAVAAFTEFDDGGNLVAGAAAHDDVGHGTHTAGTIAGRPVNGTTIGAAPAARLVCAKVIEGGKVMRRVLAGLDWAIGQGVRIVSLSLGQRGYDEALRPIFQILRSKNILPICAIGNEGANTSRSPGNYPEALSVGACDQADTVASFSSSAQFSRQAKPTVPDVVAPGVGILSCRVGGGYYEDDGSSMATPLVAGLAALLWSANPTATVDEIEDAIVRSSQLPAAMPQERGGHGVPDGPSALNALKSAMSASGALSAASLNAGKGKGNVAHIGNVRPVKGKKRSPPRSPGVGRIAAARTSSRGKRR